ncbi:NAD(P)-dependent alcohol dehydrogenase [Mycobacterium sp. 21AC1]|uniref:NAD(P)-dependent alcohol dehydrogenase n=1 Tax=[Mycobacterium] appelbergii TaxID=2939269 RepID=UPI0029392197|nr:NAD(P)-dependent alcohol dehydrogenase [Mycobacterium sp. 21AC1]MDV3130247.1 NAD(P)-dependent alcohol dehydrogenase [Mycobacterium sp. 21AC1]
MKAVRLHDYHKPPSVEDVPDPVLTGPLDVIVKIGGAGVCRTDLHIVEGQWEKAMNPTLPYTLGHENAGWIVEAGAGVTNVAVGDVVIMHPQPSCGFCPGCRCGNDMLCDNAFFPGVSDHNGGMAEYLRTSARACVKLRPGTEPAEVAALADAGLTAYHAVRKAIPLLPPGTTAVVQGIGGLGHIGIQALTALTATTIVAVDTNPAALDLAKSIGAGHIVLADGSHIEHVTDITDGHGADVVFDFVAEGGAEQDAWSMTANGGSHYVIGYGGELRVPTAEFVLGQRNVVGNSVGSHRELIELMELAHSGRIMLHSQRYPLDAAAQALDDLANERVRGRAVLVP